MNEVAFVERREPDWQRLKKLCDAADNSPAMLTQAEFREFVRLYRKVSGDLAVIRTRSGNEQLASFLNDLVGRAYGILYRSPRGSLKDAIQEALCTAARVARRRKWYLLISASIFLFAAFFTSALMSWRPETRSYFVSAEAEELFDAWKSGRHPERNTDQNILMTGFYATNNPRVALIAGSVGAATFGVFSIYLIYANGMLIGALGHEVAQVGQLDHLLVSVLPHGVTELSGMVFSGAAGLVFGWALIKPGRRKRSQALLEEGKDGVVLLVTSVIMMYMAAPIEGFFSFNPAVPNVARLIFIAASALAWFFFWTSVGREEEAEIPTGRAASSKAA